MTEKHTNLSDKILCACGQCHELINRFDKKGHKRKFKLGHNSKVKIDRECYACDSHESRDGWCHNAPIGVICRRCFDSIVRGPTRNKRKRSMQQIKLELSKRRCYACGCKHSDFNESMYWLLNYDTDGNTLCSTCFYHYIYNYERNLRMMRYKGKPIKFAEPIRDGTCDICGRSVNKAEIKMTQRHHYAQYIDDEPLKYTLETCVSCHTYETWMLGQFDNRWNVRRQNQEIC